MDMDTTKPRKAMYKAIKSSIIALTAFLIFPSCGYSQMETAVDLEKSFSGIEEIEINGGFLEVTYEGRENDSEVFLNAYLESNRKEDYDIVYRVDGRKLKVELKRLQGSGGNNRNSGFISLTGPENVRLNVTNSSGRMFISGLSNREASFKCSSGRIDLKNLMVDNIKINASSGKIDGYLLGGNVNCTISSGSVNLEKVDGNVTLKGSSGRFTVKEVQGKVNTSMSSGNVTLENIHELGNASVSSGRIKGSGVGLGRDTDLKTSSGSITLQTNDDLDDYNFDLTGSSGTLTVGNQKGKKKMNIDNRADATVRGRVSSGKISITN
jgi:lia operon protein LiaG